MKSIWDRNYPSKNEYGEFYHKYVDHLDRDNIIDILINQRDETSAIINSLDQEQALHRYANDKWTVKEVIGHIIDTERTFAYRALCFSRGDSHELHGFDQDEYVDGANFNERSLENLEEEYTAQRNSNISLFSSFTEEILNRKGIASNNRMTVRSIPFIIAGHERHHLKILKSKYGLNF